MPVWYFEKIMNLIIFQERMFAEHANSLLVKMAETDLFGYPGVLNSRPKLSWTLQRGKTYFHS